MKAQWSLEVNISIICIMHVIHLYYRCCSSRSLSINSHRWTDGSTNRPIAGSKCEFTRISSIHFRRWDEFTSERWYCISEVNAMFRKTYEYNRSKYRIKTNPESETNRVTVTFLHACHMKIRYLTCRIISDSDITWIVVESSQGMKSFYFEEANCTVLASYFHIRKGCTDQSCHEGFGQF